MIAAGLLIAAQLVAMIMVVGGQVEKAQLRVASQDSMRAALAECIENSRGAAVSDCERISMSSADQKDADQAAPSRQGISLITFINRY